MAGKIGRINMREDSERIISAIDREINKSRNEIVDLDDVIEFKEFKNKLPIYKGQGFGIERDWPKDFVLQMLKSANTKNICFETGQAFKKSNEARGFSIGNALSRRIYVLATRCP